MHSSIQGSFDHKDFHIALKQFWLEVPFPMLPMTHCKYEQTKIKQLTSTKQGIGTRYDSLGAAVVIF